MPRSRTESFAPARRGRADGGLSGQDESAGSRERIGRGLGAADDAAQGNARLRPRSPVLPRGRSGRRAPGTLGARKAEAEERQIGRASCRERVEMSVVGGWSKKENR